ncbi:phage uncharacterized protein [Hydrogenobacter thermophilus TK-6]|uniref:Phage uncharacterized protein n=1 Tax=Hydrogenobacter thermophilus (strain DSM 6534 / IAM 12695 / TK-6) TaxID=608538 RepID=D3DGQ3_HYDTT|nr:phage terminase large subunit [Hydrogenobacter thermophilus]ADO44941.1 phage uncharacterized protein [Hydrogenobacter thermophilus TK-6]BAI69005.1 phage uncharacterized protein [Hydrogenobacter thermophilus TK-6]
MQNETIEVLDLLLSKPLPDLAELLFPHYCTHKPADIHYELAELLTESKQNLVIAFPREFAKSTYVWIFFPAWNILHCKYRYIVYIASSKERAEEQLRNLRAEITAHPLLSSLIEIKKDNADELEYLDLASMNRCLIRAYGAGQNLRGIRYHEKRPDIVILDDIEDSESVQSETQRKKLKEWFHADVRPLSSTGRIFVIGTVLHEDSLLNNLLTNPPFSFRGLRYGIIDEEGKPTWEDRFTLEWIERKREDYRAQGLLHVFYREYMNIALAPEEQIFKKEYFQYYDPVRLDTLNFNIFTTVDLAISKSDTADFTAIATVAVSPENHWFVLDIDYGRYDPSEQIEAIFRAVKKYKPLIVGIEKVAYQSALAHFLQKEMLARGLFFRVQELKAEKKKELRIQALQPRFTIKAVWFPAGAHFLTELESELLMFPRGKHDDLIDALAYMEQIAYPPIHHSEGELPSWSL